MLRKLGHRFEAFFRATTPDPFVLAVGLTLLVFALAMSIQGATPLEVVRAWQGDTGFWSLLAFSMQMVLILVTGHALAATKLVSSAIQRLASWPQTGPQGAAMVAAVAIAAGLLNWGLGLIVGALLARQVGRAAKERGTGAHYPLVVAAGYAGMMCWHGGFSGTAPLKMTTAADLERFLGPELARIVDPVPFTETVLGAGNLITSGGLLVIVPCVAYLLAPKRNDAAVSIAAFDVSDGEAHVQRHEPQTVPERIEESPITMVLIAVPLLGAIALWFVDVGIGALDPNAINLIFLTAGLVLHGSLARYAAAVGEAVKGATGIVLQFPFYAGIMGVMRATGLAGSVSEWLVKHAPSDLYTVVTFLSAGLVNLFVPSGGGQWAVQGPIAVQAARALGIPIEQAIMAVAYGDQWSNMLQPFWALPLLSITGIKAREILGYTTLFMIAGGVWMVGCLYVQLKFAT